MSAAPLLLLALPGAEDWAERLAAPLGAGRCALESRRFPDGESYLRVAGDVAGRAVAVVAQLREPDPQLAALLFLGDTLRELGAARVGLVAPYLPYMRQDARFRPGEAVTSRSFAKLLSGAYDALATVDPHLHRHRSLDEIYALDATVAPSAPAIAAWLQAEVAQPHLVGPDEESAQWVGAVAELAGCPHAVLRKQRRGDRDVTIELPALESLRGRTPVLLDDIVSSAHTMAEAARRLLALGAAPPVCVAVHALFAGDALALLHAAGAARIASCNTLPHPSNAIDVTASLAQAVRAVMARAES